MKKEGRARRPRTLIGFAAALILIVVVSAFAAIMAMRAPQTITSSQSRRASDHAGLPSSQAIAAVNQSPRISLSKLQMSFEPNLGQSDPAVKFLTRGPGYTLFLTAHEAVLSMHPAAPRNAPAKPSSVVRIALSGAAHAPQLIGVDQMEGRSNYFIGSDPKKWRTDVPSYAKVELKNVYPGIDLIYHGSADGQLEYDFRLAPGADPNAIRLSFRGAGNLALNEQGDLILNVGQSKLVQHAPAIYQESGGARRTIAGGWRLHGVHEAGFRMAAYDRSRATVIDPPLVYSTYLGGSGVCGADGVSGSCLGDTGGFFIDSMGNAYISGTAYSADFPTTAGAFQTTNHAAAHNGANIFVAKLNASGSGLIYSTYLGGSGVCKGSPAVCSDDLGGGVQVDSSGNVFIVGTAISTDFPTTAGAFQTTNKAAAIGSTNIFMTKLNSTGSALIYSTYLGGSGVCGADGVPNFCAGDTDVGTRVDSSGNAYVAGFVYSTDFPTTPGAFQTVNHGAGNKTANLTVTKLNPAGSALIYSTYLGGSGVCSGPTMVCSNDVGVLSNVDSSGNAYLSGEAFSTDFPTTAGAFQTVNNAAGNNTSNGFVTKLNAAGSALIYSTYLGGSGVCGADGEPNLCIGDSLGINTVDSSGNAYIGGTSYSTDFPTTPGAFQTVNNGAANKTSNVIATKLNAAGSALIFSTYLGGSGVCGAEGIAGLCSGDVGAAGFIDSSGDAYIAGQSFSTDFPTTAGAFQTTNNAAGNKTNNGFLAKLNPAGSALIYSTYLGGSGVCGADGSSGFCLGDSIGLSFVDSSGNAFIGGIAFSPDFPTTPGAFQTVNHGAGNKTSNLIVTKLNAAGSSLIYSTYLGGSGVCGADGLAGLCEGDIGGVFIAPSGNAYIGGDTFSTDFPTTPGAFQTTNHAAGNHGSNLFLTQLVLAASGPTATATPTATVTTPTATPTATTTATPSATATATPTSTGSRTATPTSTTTATLTATATPTPTATLTATPTRTGTPVATPTVTATVTGTATTTITPSATPTAMASASPAMNIKASPGATASAGTLTVANNSGAPMVTSQVMVSFGNADLFTSATMTASFGETTLTSTVSPVTGGNSPEQPNQTAFNFNPPLVIPDGQSATFALSVVVTTTPNITMWRRPVMYASIVPGDGLGGWGGGLLASMLLLSIGTTLVASSRPRRMYFVLVLVLLAMTSQVGCDNGSSGGGSSSSSSGTPTSTQKAQNVTATNQNTGGGITVSGLPVTLSTISVP